MKKFIAYYRVSTKRQGQSGLGLEAQVEAVRAYLSGVGGELLASYEEVESGRKSKRPELLKAIAHARAARAVLVVAKLDRLSRNMAFTSMLMESGLEFVCCDNPHTNKFTIHILAAMAQYEAEVISKRTKEALAAYKVRGGKLGAHRPGFVPLAAEKVRAVQGLASAGNVEAAAKHVKDLLPKIREWRFGLGLSLRGVADRLNAEGYVTRAGKPWTGVQVYRVLGK